MSEERAHARRNSPPEKFVRKESFLPEARIDAARATEELKKLLDVLLKVTQLEVSYDIKPRAGAETPAGEAGIIVAFRGADEQLLLQHNAELLLAIEHIAHRWLRLDPRLHDQVRFDCGDYRATRLEELKLSARVAAQRVRETGQSFPFNPMSSRDRRIIHLELNGAAGVRTVSEGSGDRRHLVIYPVTKK